MAILLGEINLFAVLVGVIVSIGVGMLWYSPILFGNVWLRLIGKSADEIEGAGPAMGLAALAAVISSLVLAMMVQAVGAATLLEGLVVGIVVGVVRRRPLRSAAIGGPAGLFFGAVGGVLLSLPADLPALLVGSLVLVVFGAVVRRYSAR